MSLFIPIPMPKTRKGAIITMIVVMVVCLIMALVAFLMWNDDQNTLKEKGQPSFNTLSADQLEHGLIVQGKIDMAFSIFAERYEEDFGMRLSDDSENLYYIVPIYNIDNNGNITFNHIMTFEADPKEFDIMNKIVNQTWSNATDFSELQIENGLVLNLGSDLEDYFYEWIEAPDFYENGSFIDWCVECRIFGTDDRDVIQSKIVPYMIDKTGTPGTDLSVVWVMLGMAVLCFIVILVLCLYKNQIKGFSDTTRHDDGFRQIREMKED